MIPTFDLIARSLLLKILFERYINEWKDYEFLIGHLKAFEKYVEFKQFTQEKKTACLNAVRFVGKMTAVKSKWRNVPESEKAMLEKKLETLLPIIMRNWLKEKIAAL